MRKLLITGLLLIILNYMAFKCIWAQEGKVDIELIFEPQNIYETTKEIPVEILYHKNLFNEEHFLSFHIYQGEELIQFENTRSIINKMENGSYKSCLIINLTSEVYDSYKELTIKPDIVDQKNETWLFQESNLIVKYPDIHYKNLNKMNLMDFLSYQFQQFTLVIIMNVFVTIFMTVTGVKIYYREKENF